MQTTKALHRRLALAAASVVAASLALAGAAHAQQPLKIGLILPFSGQFADTAVQLENGIKAYVSKHGDTIAGRKIEFLRRDTGGVAPDVAKRLAQELVVRDNVDILAGFVLTPNAMAVGDVSAQAKKFMVVMNAGTSVVITKSPYMIRTSLTLPQISEAFGTWSAKAGIKKVFSMVSDFAPGHDSEQAFIRAFKEGGGEIVGNMRFPLASPDFSAYVQRAKDLKPEAIHVWVPAGAQPAAFGKAFSERGLDPKVTRILGSGEATSEEALKSMGDISLGIITAWNYDHNQDSPLNREFVKLYSDLNKRNPDFMSVGAWDGMHVIYETLKKTGGKADAEALTAAAKGMKWESPRGPISINPETGDIVQNVYIRRVEKTPAGPRNVVFDKIENVVDPVLARMKK